MNNPGAADQAAARWQTCDGAQLRRLAQAGLAWLEQNVPHVNALNVFPVPDGDTGTNMFHTMRAAVDRAAETETDHAGVVASALSHGALMGARGNSGVILSQIWRGLANNIKDKPSIGPLDLAAALKEAADTAYKGVMKPVEGTILTVVREGAAEAQDAAPKSPDFRFLLERVLERCQLALERTPDLLPVLKQAGVVDSGGQGLVYILEGMQRFMAGQVDLSPSGVSAALSPATAQALAAPLDGQLEFPYDVQFIVQGRGLNLPEVRRQIDAMGDSTVVVGDESTIKVHIHVKDPGRPLSYGASLGHLSDIVVENMQQQMEAIIGGTGTGRPEVGHPEAEPVAPALEPGQIGVVAVAAGPGLATIYRSLGVAAIVRGGQTNNPSTEEILQAVESLPTERVIVLPNNKNIILAAEAARDVSTKEVVVLASRSVPQGVSALMGFNPDGDLADTAAAMKQAMAAVRTAEITTATRSVALNGVEVSQGDLIGLLDGRLCTAGQDLVAVVRAVLEVADLDEHDLVSIYYGQEVTAETAAEMAAQVATWYPDVDVELLAGGQAHYFYILGIE